VVADAVISGVARGVVLAIGVAHLLVADAGFVARTYA
jgi:hypothetical protein